MVTWNGSISVARPMKNSRSRPGNFRLANVYATSEHRNSWSAVIAPVTMVLLRIHSPMGWSELKNRE